MRRATLLAMSALSAGLLATTGVAAVTAIAQPRPTAPVSRTAAIAATIRAAEAECTAAAGGDWNRWFAQLQPFRDELSTTIADLQNNHQRTTTASGARVALLKAPGTLPLFVEALSAGHIAAWGTNPQTLDRFLEEATSLKVIEQTSAWLARQGIDLIFVPVPKMAQIYPERIATRVPPSRNVAPQMRRMVLDLSRAGVEVLDLLPLFLAAPDKDRDPLTIPSDPHWSNRAEVLTAEALAPRLRRYAFVRTNLAAPPRFTTVSVPPQVPGGYKGAFWEFLTPDEQKEMAGGLQFQVRQVLERRTQQPVEATDGAPVLIMGDSYTVNTVNTIKRGAGIVAHIARMLNGPVSLVSVAGGRTEPLKELARNPDLLAHTKVVVWVINYTSFALPWESISFPTR